MLAWIVVGLVGSGLAATGLIMWLEKDLPPHLREGYVSSQPETKTEAALAESVPTSTVVELALVKEQPVPTTEVKKALAA